MAIALSGALTTAQQAKKEATNRSIQPRLTPSCIRLWNGVIFTLFGQLFGGCYRTFSRVSPTSFYFGSTGGGVWRHYRRMEQAGIIFPTAILAASIGAWRLVNTTAMDDGCMEGWKEWQNRRFRAMFTRLAGIWKGMDSVQNLRTDGTSTILHISRIRIHPAKPEPGLCCCDGRPVSQPSGRTKGASRHQDGGKTGNAYSSSNADAGAVDLLLDPNNPRVIFASTWRVRRTPVHPEAVAKAQPSGEAPMEADRLVEPPKRRLSSWAPRESSSTASP